MITQFERDASAILSTAYSRMAVELAKKNFRQMDIHFLSEQFANYIFKVSSLGDIDEKINEFISDFRFANLKNPAGETYSGGSTLGPLVPLAPPVLDPGVIRYWTSLIDSLEKFSTECMAPCKENLGFFEKDCVKLLESIYEIPMFLILYKLNFNELKVSVSSKSTDFIAIKDNLLNNLTDHFIYCYIMMKISDNENARYAIDTICDILGTCNYLDYVNDDSKSPEIIYNDLLKLKKYYLDEIEKLNKVSEKEGTCEFYLQIKQLQRLKFKNKINEITLSYYIDFMQNKLDLSRTGYGSPFGSNTFESIFYDYIAKYEFSGQFGFRKMSELKQYEHTLKYNKIISEMEKGPIKFYSNDDERLYFYLRSKYSKDIAYYLFESIIKPDTQDFIDRLSSAIGKLSSNAAAFDEAKNSSVTAIYTKSIPNIGSNTDMLRKLVEGNYSMNQAFITISGEINNIYFPDKNASLYYAMLAMNRILGIKDALLVEKLTKQNSIDISDNDVMFDHEKDILRIINMVSPYEIRVFLEKTQALKSDFKKYSTLTKFPSIVGINNPESFFTNLLAKLYFKFTDFEIPPYFVNKISLFYGEVWQEENRSSKALAYLSSTANSINFKPIYVPAEVMNLEKMYKSIQRTGISNLTAEDNNILDGSLKFYEANLEKTFDRFNRHKLHPMIYYYYKEKSQDRHVVLIDSAENSSNYVFRYMGGHVISLVTPFVKGSSLPGIDRMDLASKGLFDVLAKEEEIIKCIGESSKIIKDLQKILGSTGSEKFDLKNLIEIVEPFLEKCMFANGKGYSSTIENIVSSQIEEVFEELKLYIKEIYPKICGPGKSDEFKKTLDSLFEDMKKASNVEDRKKAFQTLIPDPAMICPPKVIGKGAGASGPVGGRGAGPVGGRGVGAAGGRGAGPVGGRGAGPVGGRGAGPAKGRGAGLAGGRGAAGRP